MKRFVLLIILSVIGIKASAFDWKPQSNDALRNEMFSFVEDFRDKTSDPVLSAALDDFLKVQKAQAQSEPYQWIYDTHDFVDEMLEKYPAERSEGGRCSLERKSLLLLRDYPMHADNKPADAPQELKDAYVNSVKAQYAAAENDALTWLRNGRKSGRLDIFKTYNMGFLFRSAGKVAAVDVQWSGPKDRMKEFASLVDVFFVTHPHEDHFTKELLVELLNAGKTVVLPCDLVPEHVGENKIIVGEDIIEPMSLGRISFVSRMGNQGKDVPCNVYVISLGKWNIAHNGDNAADGAESFLSQTDLDVFVGACWNGMKDTMNHIKANPRGTDCLYISSHENEWGHTVDHRESYEELFRRTDRLGDPDYDYLTTVVTDAAGDYLVLK